MQETKQRENFIDDIEDFTFLNSGGESRIYGTGNLINKRLKQALIGFQPVSERISCLRIKGMYRTLSIHQYTWVYQIILGTIFLPQLKQSRR